MGAAAWILGDGEPSESAMLVRSGPATIPEIQSAEVEGVAPANRRRRCRAFLRMPS